MAIGTIDQTQQTWIRRNRSDKEFDRAFRPLDRRFLPFEAAAHAAVRHHDFAEPPVASGGRGRGGVADGGGVRLVRPVKDRFELIGRMRKGSGNSVPVEVTRNRIGAILK